MYTRTGRNPLGVVWRTGLSPLAPGTLNIQSARRRRCGAGGWKWKINYSSDGSASAREGEEGFAYGCDSSSSLSAL